MRTMRIKLAVAGVILVVAFGYLAVAGMQKGWVYLVSVEKYLDDPQLADQRVRLHGKVAEEDFHVSAVGTSATFVLAGESRTVPVAYRGTIPDMFQAGRDVVVEGRRDDAGVFQADLLMTKCASKYEPESPHSSELEKQS